METDSSSPGAPREVSQERESIAKELQDIKEELDQLIKESDQDNLSPPTSTTPPTQQQPFLMTGFLFLIGFFLTSQTHTVLFDIISSICFIVMAICFIPVVADIFYRKTITQFEYALSIALVLLLSLSLLYFWNAILHTYLFVIYYLLLVILGLQTLFFLLHLYQSYMKRHAQREASMTVLILIATLLLALSVALFTHMLIYILFIISLLLFTKANIDFTKRFRTSKK
jgi:cbb3-type cytochrome oxidase subunit 3